MTIIKHEISKTEEKYYEKYPAVKLVINSNENVLTGKSWSNRKIEPHGNPSKKEYLEQLVTFRKGVKLELPITIEVGYDRFEDDELIKWYEAQFKTRPKGSIITIDAEDIELGEEINNNKGD